MSTHLQPPEIYFYSPPPTLTHLTSTNVNQIQLPLKMFTHSYPPIIYPLLPPPNSIKTDQTFAKHFAITFAIICALTLLKYFHSLTEYCSHSFGLFPLLYLGNIIRSLYFAPPWKHREIRGYQMFSGER